MRPTRRSTPTGLRLVAAALGLVLGQALLAGCQPAQTNQPKYKPLAASRLFADGASARQPVEGTVARGELHADRAFYAGMAADGAFLDALPVAVDHRLLERGRERFDIFCSPCHDRLGTGRGMIVRRGYKQPPSFHEPRLRQQKVGYFFDVITHGFGTMPAYASQIPPADRWAIVAYLRALQLSRSLSLADLPASEREKAERELARGGTAATEGVKP